MRPWVKSRLQKSIEVTAGGVAQLMECLSSVHKVSWFGLIPSINTSGTRHGGAYNPSTQESQAGKSEVQGHFLYLSLSYIYTQTKQNEK